MTNALKALAPVCLGILLALLALPTLAQVDRDPDADSGTQIERKTQVDTEVSPATEAQVEAGAEAVPTGETAPATTEPAAPPSRPSAAPT